MFQKNWKTEILTIPNLLSLLRLALIPLYLHLYLNAVTPRQYHIAGGILAISCLTDAIDGKIARRFHMESTVGKILDPLADKLTQFTLILCLAVKHTVLKPLLVFFVVKEILQSLLGLFYLHRGQMLPGALPVGKVCTAVLFCNLTLLVFFPEMQSAAVKAIALTNVLFLILSFVSYFFAYLSGHPKVRDIRPE